MMMASFNNFRNSFRQISSFPHRGDSQARSSPTLHGLPNIDHDVPLDAFDRDLLAGCLPESYGPVEYGQSRVSLPPRTTHGPIRKIDVAHMFKDDLHSAPIPTHASSSSSAAVASSPTVVALRNRNTHNAYGSSHANTTRNDRTGNFNEHVRSIIMPDTERLSQPIQEENSASQRSCATVTARLKGNLTRIGLGHAPPTVQGIPLIAATELPDRYRSIFPFAVFNAVQSKCFSTAFGSSDNLVVSAPTGSGKTAIMELAICQLMREGKAGDFKVVYQAPTKSLCSERMRDWSGRFESLGMPCAELTGDTEHYQLKNVQSASIIITTPEKWDSVTRKWKDNARLMKMVKLFLIDEVHILKESRGATLEAVVSRMKSVGSNVRFVALSATVPNSDDIAAWLGKASDAQHLPAHREVFGEEFRPVKLEKHVCSIRGPLNDFAFDMVLNDHVKEAISRHSKRKPTMIFCTTRKMAGDTAKMLSTMFATSQTSHRLWPPPRNSYQIVDQELSKLVMTGVAFHHGGMDAADRRSIEEGFLNTDISIICCTSTLAIGVNLPCYLVIIKGTVMWTDKGAQEYHDLEVMQMLGRAGRPQFESSACAVILTRPEREQHYKKMVSGEEILESCLHLNLIDHLNSEIGLGTVMDIMSAKKWLASTFMFVRLQKNPRHYQLKAITEPKADEDLLESICMKGIGLLKDAHLVTDGPRTKCTEYGDAMARYCVKFDTMKAILAMAPKAKISEIISTLAQAREFSDIRFKAGEKGLYKELNADVSIKFPIKVDIAQHSHKISLLIQAELGGSVFPYHDKWKKHKAQFNSDKTMVFSHLNRLIRCVIDCQLQLEDAVSVRHSLELARSLAARVWDNSPFQMKQIEGIGDVAVRKLAQADINSVAVLQITEPHRIESLIGRHPPFGQKMLAKAMEFPSLRVSVKQVGKERIAGKGIKIQFEADVGFVNEKIPIWFHKKMVYVCVLTETSGGQLVDFRRFAAKGLEHGQEILLCVQLTRPTTSINCHVMCDEIAGTCRTAELNLKHLPDSCFPAPSVIGIDSSNTETNAKTMSKIPQNCDEYGDLDDADLLAAFDNEEGVEVIHDIDQVVEESKEPVKKTLKRTASKITTDGDVKTTVFKEPVQLDNGRWTCQHSCHTQGKTCKHLCCAGGVEKPARAGRKKAKKDDIKQTAIDNTVSKLSARSTPFEKAYSQAEVTKQKLLLTNVQQTSNLDTVPLQVWPQTTQVSGLVFSKISSHPPKPVAATNLSFMQNPYGLSNNISEAAESQVIDVNDTRVSLDEQSHENTRSSHADFVDFFDFDVEELDQLPGKACVDTDAHELQTSHTLTSGPKHEHKQTQLEQNHNNCSVAVPFVENTWSSPSTNLGAFQATSAEVSWLNGHGVAVPDTSELAASGTAGSNTVELSSEADLGIFHSPLSRPAGAATQTLNQAASTAPLRLSLTHKAGKAGHFIMGDSSSSDVSLQRTPEAANMDEDNAQPTVEAFLAELTAINYNPCPAKLVPSRNALPDLPPSPCTGTLSSLAGDEMERQPLAPLGNLVVRAQAGNSGKSSASFQQTMINRKERRNELAMKEQRGKWEGLEDLYEEFGDFVEIVD